MDGLGPRLAPNTFVNRISGIIAGFVAPGSEVCIHVECIEIPSARYLHAIDKGGYIGRRLLDNNRNFKENPNKNQVRSHAAWNWKGCDLYAAEQGTVAEQYKTTGTIHSFFFGPSTFFSPR